jgi:hypothetical protein
MNALKLTCMVILTTFLTFGNPAIAEEKKSTEIIATELYCKDIPYGRYNAPLKIKSEAYAAIRTMPAYVTPLVSGENRPYITIRDYASRVCVKVTLIPFD